MHSHCDQADVFRMAVAQAGAEAFVSKDDLGLRMVRAWRK